jgi:hypothetical protein
MLDAYRGIPQERPPVAPEFWIYYPARFLGTDLITFEREVPFHIALKEVFTTFACEGWGAVFLELSNPEAKIVIKDLRIDSTTLETRKVVHYRGREFSQTIRYTAQNPSWLVEAPVKDIVNDLPVWMEYLFGQSVQTLDSKKVRTALDEVGEAYLLEGWLGVPFFDFYAANRHGAFEAAVFDFLDPALEPMLLSLRARYEQHLIALATHVVTSCDMESFVIGCSYSCVSLLGTKLWRKWDKPLLINVVQAIHDLGKLVHIHFHGKCMDVIEDLKEIGADCVCPFERPPGGDLEGYSSLVEAMTILDRKVTFNGNVHTIDTLIRGTRSTVRSEVAQIKKAARDTGMSHRLIIGSGDQVGGETPDENILAMIEEGKRV